MTNYKNIDNTSSLFRITRMGESGLSLSIQKKPDRDTPVIFKNIVDEVSRSFPVLDYVISFASLLVIFKNPRSFCLSAERDALWEIACNRQDRSPSEDGGKRKTHRIPVCYSPSMAEDLESMALSKDISVDQLIRDHSDIEYIIFALGFVPGFPFCGFVSPLLATPRRATPRQKVPGGSVGIAGEQTGIYPLDSPGGWNIVGRTPLQIYDPSRNPFTSFNVGDLIRFEPISIEDFKKLEGKWA